MDNTVAEFLTQLLNTSHMLANFMDNVTGTLIEHGDDPEEASADVLAMVAGSLSLRFSAVPARDLIRSTELLALAVQSVLDDTAEALALVSQNN